MGWDGMGWNGTNVMRMGWDGMDGMDEWDWWMGWMGWDGWDGWMGLMGWYGWDALSLWLVNWLQPRELSWTLWLVNSLFRVNARFPSNAYMFPSYAYVSPAINLSVCICSYIPSYVAHTPIRFLSYATHMLIHYTPKTKITQTKITHGLVFE